MTAADRYRFIYDKLYELYGDCACPLIHETPFQLLAAVMLSAQCKDERVNMVTRQLFALAPDAEQMAKLPVERIREIIHPCGLDNAKSRNLQAAAAMIVERFGGHVPRTMEELTQLPGIGRKSANVILGNAFNIPGFPVDTHVTRLLNRLGMVTSSIPEKIEAAVCRAVPPELWCKCSHLLITHGRQVCPARKPDCDRCPLNSMCKFNGGK